MHEIHMQQEFAAPPERVFAALTDHASMGQWVDGVEAVLERQGTPPPNGLGAVRRVRAQGLNVWEEVVRWEEPTAMDYRLTRGGPIRDHLGEMRFRPNAKGGTSLDYRIRFRVPWYFGGALLGGLVASRLKRDMQAGLGRIASRLR